MTKNLYRIDLAHAMYLHTSTLAYADSEEQATAYLLGGLQDNPRIAHLTPSIAVERIEENCESVQERVMIIDEMTDPGELGYCCRMINKKYEDAGNGRLGMWLTARTHLADLFLLKDGIAGVVFESTTRLFCNSPTDNPLMFIPKKLVKAGVLGGPGGSFLSITGSTPISWDAASEGVYVLEFVPAKRIAEVVIPEGYDKEGE